LLVTLRKRQITMVGMALALTLTAAAAACGNDLAGDVLVDGSSTVGPMSEAAAELFQAENPDVHVTVGISGSGAGFQKFCRGETDVSDASRPIEEEDSEEGRACERAGIGYRRFQVANDGITVVVNKDNDFVDCLTVEQLKMIWGPDSQVDDWNEVDPDFPDMKIELFGPGTDSGTFDYFTDVVNGEDGRSRTDYTPSEDDNVLVQGVAGSPGGMGYFGFTYYEENTDALRVVEIDGGDGCVAPSRRTVQDGSYTPLARPLFIYASAKGIEKPQVEAFVEFYLVNAAAIADAARFIPMTDEQVAESQAALEQLRSGAGGGPSGGFGRT
jgi:phosphate transport system substrate-binding protein